jgi:5'-phosphate synthase pdxT subunit
MVMRKDVGLRSKDTGERPTTHDLQPTSPGVAVLALQGDFEAHRRKLAAIGIASFEARRPEQLEHADGLILPGGESTTMWKFFETGPWEKSIREFAAIGRPILGTCAGAILLAAEVTHPIQKGMGLLDISVERNAYGRQLDSFIGQVDAPALGGALPAVFIRAPRIRRIGREVETLARRAGEPVLVRQANILAATFHPELTEDERVHRLAFDAGLLQRRQAQA